MNLDDLIEKIATLFLVGALCTLLVCLMIIAVVGAKVGVDMILGSCYI